MVSHLPHHVYRYLRILDFIFAGIFTTEMIIKWIVFGLAFHPGAYMRSGWNLLDMATVLTSLAAIIMMAVLSSASEASSVRVLRLGRVLRPLRSVHRIPKLKTVVECLYVALL